MNISGLSVRRGVTFLMLYLMVVGFGLFSLVRLQLDLYPEISFPMVAVLTTYTGASPEDIETLITRPIEGTVATVKDVEEVDSTSKQGVSLVQVGFDWDKDMEQAETDVRRALEMIEQFLPDDADDPLVFAFDPSMQPIVMLMVSGPYPLDELRRIADDEIGPRIARLPGVALAQADGGLEREIQVVLDPAKVTAFGLDVNQIVATVYRENTQVPGGRLQQGSLDFTIQTKGKYQSVEEIGEVVVGTRQNGLGPVPIRLKEVARVEDSFFEADRVLEVDHQPAVWMIVRKQSGANSVRSSEAVIDALPKIERELAAQLEFKIIFNQAEFINKALGNLSSTGMVAVLITFFVLLFFLRNVRSALIVATAIPTSVITTFAVMDAADMTLNMLSMAGLALAIGLLVDNSIVVLENIFRLREEGQNAWTAAIEGSRSVALAVTASTLTTISVFVPVLFVPGIAGVMFQDMAVTICFSLAVSLFVALTFIPLASSRLLGTRRAAQLLKRAHESDVFAAPRRLYGRWLARALERRWIVGAGVGGAILVAAGMMTLLPTEFVTESDDGFLFVSAEAPIGTNLEAATEMMGEVQAAIERVVPQEDRKLVGLDVGVGRGFTAIFAKGVHAALFRVPLVSVSEREVGKKEYEQRVRDELKRIPGLKYTVAQPFNIMGGAGDIEIQIRGHDLEVSRAIGLELRDRLLEEPDVGDVTYSMDDQKPEVRVRFDRPKLAQLGMSAAAANNAISAYFQGTVAGRYAEGGDEYDILVRYAKEHRLDIDELRRMPLATPWGESVPLANVADLEIGLGPVDITRLDQERVTRVNVYLKPSWQDAGGSHRKDLGASIDKIEQMLEAYPWPRRFTYKIGGSAEDFLTSFKYLGLALAISVLLVYMVMASQFESFRQPFIIIFSVPLAAIGVVLMFSITRSTIDVSALVGVIMLVGIVVNNGIVMVDAANQLRARGNSRRDAIYNAALIRMRPVLMTSLTTILAMTPLALEIGEGAEGWGGMAKAVIGGLAAASFLTLFVVPTVYTVFAKKDAAPVAETKASSA
jgi:HAE1 family hydrophobic/amphiphilic exporter-1